MLCEAQEGLSGGRLGARKYKDMDEANPFQQLAQTPALFSQTPISKTHCPTGPESSRV